MSERHQAARTERKKNSRVSDARKTVPFGEYRFGLLVEAMRDYAISLLDSEGRILTWNSGAQLIQGHRAEEVIGRHFSIFYPQEDVRLGKPQLELEIARREGRCEDEGFRVRKDGSQFWADVVITALRDESGRLYGFGKVTRDLTARKLAEDASLGSARQLEEEIKYRIEAERSAREAEASVRDLSQRLLRLQDEERRRVGRELHDSVGQLLVATKMALAALAAEPDRRKREARFTECEMLLEQTIREVRTVSYLFYPPMLEESGLRIAVESYLEGFRQRSGLRIDFEISQDFGRLSRDMELALFRVLQESLTNVHRHSGSSTAQVRLRMESETVILEVQDQGKGAPPAALELGSDSIGTLGVGLRGMNERLRQLGGKLEVVSSERGTTVRATAPAQAGHDFGARAAAASGRSG